MDDILFKAILAMDSYNRGYNAGIDLNIRDENGDIIQASDAVNVKHVGNAVVYQNKGDAAAQAAGFYGIAYQYTIDANGQVQAGTGQTTISYRGTDQFLDASPNPDPNSDATKEAVGGEIRNAFGVGAGTADTAQSRLAIQFYQAVVDSTDPDDFYYAAETGAVSVTGHSMGAGLAGLVGAIYGADGILFDNMAFKAAANSLMSYNSNTNPYSSMYPDPDGSGSQVSLYQLINGTVGAFLGSTEENPAVLDPRWEAGGIYAPDFSNLSADYVEGEALDAPFVGHLC